MSTEDYLSAINNIGNIDFTIAAEDTHKDLSNVYIRKRGDVFHVQFTLLGQTQHKLSRAWKTGLALDASASMKVEYGRRVLGDIPYKIYNDYQNKGWISSEIRDGQRVKTLQRLAVTDALNRGLIRLSPNTLDYIGPELLTYLAGSMDYDGSTSLIYWGGGNGNEIEVVGDIKSTEAATISIDGPDQMMFGDKSVLLPAVKFFVDKFKDAPLGMFVFITDARIDDIQEVKRYTTQLAREIAADKRSPLKCILVGIGDQIHSNEVNLKHLCSHDTETYVNLWDYMTISDLQDVLKIFAEVVRDSQIVAAEGNIYDAQGQKVKSYPRGLPNRIGFSLPVTSPWFELEVPSQRIRQNIKIPTYILRG